MNQKMSPEAQKVLEKIMSKVQQGTGGQTTPDGLPLIGGDQHMPDVTEILAMQMRTQEMQIAHILKGFSMIGTSADLSRLNLQMIMKLLVDKDIVSQEEMEKLFKEDVIDELSRMEEEAKKAAEEEYNATKEAAEQAAAAAVAEGEDRLKEITPDQNEEGAADEEEEKEEPGTED